MIVRIAQVSETEAEIRLYSGDDFDPSYYKENGGSDEIALVIDEGKDLAASTLCSTEARVLAHALLAAADSADEASEAQPPRLRQ